MPSNALAAELVRDRFWIFTCVAGSDNPSLARGGFPGGSRMTPAEGAFYLDVPNLMMVRWEGLPAPPFDREAISFRPLAKVVWSIVGSGGRTDGDELSSVLDLAHRFSNLTGVIMDDFFKSDGTAHLSEEDLGRVRSRLASAGRRLDLHVVLYTHQLDLPVTPFLAHCDIITLWTWNADHLGDLERNLRRLEERCPGPRKMLGCYMWDFPNHRPVPVGLMQDQCGQGLAWLKEGRIDGMIFLANTVSDLGLASVEWTREWIRRVGREPLHAA